MRATRVIVAIGIAAFFFLFTVPPMFASPPWPYTGINAFTTQSRTLVRGAFSSASSTVTIDRDSPAYRAGLRTGDTISCLDARTFGIITSVPHQVYDGLPIQLCVRRGSAWQPVSLLAQRRPSVGLAYISPWLAALRALVYLIYLIVGCALVIARPSLMSWLLFAYCVGTAPFTAVADGAMLSAWQDTALLLLMTMTSSSIAGALTLFALVVPEHTPPRGWRRAVFVVVGAATLASAVLNSCIVLAHDYTSAIGQWCSGVLTIAAVLVVLARLATMHRSERARFGWAAFAIIFGVVDNSLRTGVISGSTFFVDVVSFVAAYLTVVMPIALMYAILRRHVIDVRFVISRGVVYAAVTTLVIALIGVVDWATSAYLHEVRAAMAIDALVTIAIGFVLHRAYGWVDRIVDSLLFREKHNAQQYLMRLARTLPFARTDEAVDNALVFAPYEKFSLAAAALYRQRRTGFTPVSAEGWGIAELPTIATDDDLIRFFLSERGSISIGELHERIGRQRFEHGNAPAIAVPIFQSNDLTGFALFGLHRDGTRLDPDEERILERLCETAAQAYTTIELTHYRGAKASIPAMETM